MTEKKTYWCCAADFGAHEETCSNYKAVTAREDQPRPTLNELLEKTRDRVMSPEEKEAQRQSWVRGEMALDRGEGKTKYLGLSGALPIMSDDKMAERVEAQGEAPQVEESEIPVCRKCGKQEGNMDHSPNWEKPDGSYHTQKCVFVAGDFDMPSEVTLPRHVMWEELKRLRARVETGAHPSQDARAEFESWFRGNWCNYVNPFDCYPVSGNYVDQFVYGHFRTWQRARSTPSPSLKGNQNAKSV